MSRIRSTWIGRLWIAVAIWRETDEGGWQFYRADGTYGPIWIISLGVVGIGIGYLKR